MSRPRLGTTRISTSPRAYCDLAFRNILALAPSSVLNKRSQREPLAAPRLNLCIVPNLPAQRVMASEAILIEQTLPIGWPLTVYVMVTGLPWRRGAEKNCIGMSGDRRHKIVT